MRRTAVACVAAAALASATACGGHYLQWRAQPPAPSLAGKVAVTVTEHRQATRGGDDPRLIGSERGALLIPRALRLSQPGEAADTIAQLFAQAALTAGVGVAQKGDVAGTRLAVDVQDLWCDGVAMAYTKAHLGARLSVVGADGTARVPALTLHAEGGAGSCRDAYEQMLNNAYSQAVNMLSQPPLKPALTTP